VVALRYSLLSSWEDFFLNKSLTLIKDKQNREAEQAAVLAENAVVVFGFFGSDLWL